MTRNCSTKVAVLQPFKLAAERLASEILPPWPSFLQEFRLIDAEMRAEFLRE